MHHLGLKSSNNPQHEDLLSYQNIEDQGTWIKRTFFSNTRASGFNFFPLGKEYHSNLEGGGVNVTKCNLSFKKQIFLCEGDGYFGSREIEICTDKCLWSGNYGG
uniref:Uncharacterized protein n=1 Tax=Sphaerodactylus townsendi TaxID=933632 RepID=A0ACB8E7G2_9SAUR